MNRNVALLLVLGLGGVGLYYILRKPKNKSFKGENVAREVKVHYPHGNHKSTDLLAGDTPEHIGKDIEAESTVVMVDEVLPEFGRPENINFKNYVSVQENKFFQPKMGSFR